jgi:acetyl esterase
VFCHGGGFALGDLDSYDSHCKRVAVGASAIVVSVDYRLAPEHPYPAAVDDAWAALQWVADHADEIGGDPARLAVAGDSAGGNLAAVLTVLARDAGGPDLRFQLLWYPVLTFDFALPSVTENATSPILNLASMQKFFSWYAADTDIANPPLTLAPGRAQTFAGLPPAFIGIAGHDPLRDDGALYAENLTAAGVPVQLSHAPTLTHGYHYFVGLIPAATETVDAAIQALGTALHR